MLETDRRFRDLYLGYTHMTGEVALATTPATTTTVSRKGLSSNGVPLLVPVDAGAAAEWGGTSLYVTPGTDQFVINHSASASTRTFRWAALYGPSINL